MENQHFRWIIERNLDRKVEITQELIESGLFTTSRTINYFHERVCDFPRIWRIKYGESLCFVTRSSTKAIKIIAWCIFTTSIRVHPFCKHITDCFWSDSINWGRLCVIFSTQVELKSFLHEDLWTISWEWMNVRVIINKFSSW